MGSLLTRYRPEMPVGVRISRSGLLGIGTRRRYPFVSSSPVPSSASLLESELRRLGDWGRYHPLTPRSYVAVLGENPGVDLGVEGTREINHQHVLLGYY
ncbi:MAG: hypothetical protein GXP27_11430 [Planctomycetes bacterium]|nr:hypothetical protein [Planctomycetota bacterium]